MKWTPIAAIICLAGLEVVAMLKGIDGALFGIVVAAIAGLGGYEIKVLKDKRKGG
uniref:Holin n=1 Tax=viral metagenome TaxID=1070528 RepID=A0A6M3XWJ4_9ZZZZ